MSSFGYVVGETASLPPSGSLYLSPTPWRPPSSIPHPPPIVRANSLSELWSIRPPRNPNFAELGPGRPEISRQVSNPSIPALLTSPAPRKMVGEAARRRPETGRLVAQLQVIRSSLSRALSEWQDGRAAQCPPRRLQLGRIGAGRPGSPGGGED